MISLFQILLLLFLLFFARASLKDTAKGIYLAIFFMPFYLIRFQLGGIPTTMLEIMIYILFFVWIWKDREAGAALKEVKEFFRKEKLLAAGIALLFFGAVLSAAHSSDLRTSLGILKGWFLDPFLFFIVFIGTIKARRAKMRALLSFIFSGFAVSLVALSYATVGVLTFDGRIRAFYESPNYLAMYLAPAFLLAFYLFAFKKNTVCKEFLAPLCKNGKLQAMILISCATAILLTRSYGVAVGIAGAIFFFMLKKYASGGREVYSKNKKTLAVLSVAALALLFFLSFQKYGQIVNSNERSSLHSRLMIWDASREMLKDSPFFGIGPGTFQQVYLEYQSRFSVPYLEWAVAEPHNTFLAFYLQTGIIGLSGFILILFWLYRKSKYDSVVFLFLVYFLIHGLVDTLYWKNDLALIFWLMLAMARAGEKKQL